MRKSYSTEIVIIFLIGIAGGLISKQTVLTFISGMIIILLTSYFIFSKLKEHTIKEYIGATADNKNLIQDSKAVCLTCWKQGKIQKDCPDCHGTGMRES